MLSIQQLAVRHKENAKIVVDSFSLQMKEGESVALVGESGAGKSSVLLSVLGLLNKNFVVTGQINFQHRDLLQLKEKQWQKIRGHEIGYVSQNCLQSFDPFFKVGTQIKELLKLYYPRILCSQLEEKIKQLLQSVELGEERNILKKYPSQLSGGMAQRLAIAFAVAGRPSLLLADELTSALDKNVEKEVMQTLIKNMHLENRALLWVTHDLKLAEKFADRIVVMKEGKKVEAGSAKEILQAPVHRYTKHLIESIPSTVRANA